MPRSIKSPSGGSTYVTTIAADQGGTGVTTAPEALLALNAIPENKLGQPLGPVQLNANGGFDPAILAGLSLSESGIDGPSSISQNATEEYFITTYDSYQTYEVVGIQGTAVRDRNVIRYTAGGTPGQGGFTINGRQIVVEITDPVVAVPTITSPANQATDLQRTLTLTASAFQTSSGQDTHQSSDWQVATDPSFSNIIASTTNDVANLTSWVATGLSTLTTYYARVRYRAQNAGVGAWSAAISFTTRDSGIYANSQIQKIIYGDTSIWPYSPDVAMSADGSVVVASYPRETSGNGERGLFVFRRLAGVWYREAFFANGTLTSSAGTGSALAMSSDGTLFVAGGAERFFVYEYVNGVWGLTAVVSDPDSTDNQSHQFGFSVAVSVDKQTLAIGAPSAMHSDGITASGSVYIYVKSGGNWVQQIRLEPSVFIYGDNGAAVALSSDGNTLLIGSPGVIDTYLNQGAAYVYKRNGTTWSLSKRLDPSDPSEGAVFGYSVALSADGKHALVGSPYRSGNNSTYGGVYYFFYNGLDWALQSIFQTADHFGMDLVMDDAATLAIVTTLSGYYTYVRNGTTWTKRENLFGQSLDSSIRPHAAMSSDGKIGVLATVDTSGSGDETSLLFYN